MRWNGPTIGCVVVGATLTLLGSPVAQADDASFVREAQAIGVSLASDNLISTAESACNFLGPRKRDPGQVLERIIRYTRVEPEQARLFFVLAVNEYCPQYAGLVPA